MKSQITQFFNGLGLFSPLDFTDPVTYFIPGFILLILGETFLYQSPQKLFTKNLVKDDFQVSDWVWGHFYWISG